jgi:hypothetical protein
LRSPSSELLPAGVGRERENTSMITIAVINGKHNS